MEQVVPVAQISGSIGMGMVISFICDFVSVSVCLCAHTLKVKWLEL